MSKLKQVMAAFGRGAAWLLPAGRRDWVAAVWAEAHDVPPGLERLAWRAGGVWVLAREALLPRRLGRAVLFAAGRRWCGVGGLAAARGGNVAEGRFNAIAPVLVLAVLPLLSRRFFGPASPSRLARSMRVLCGAAVLALVPLGTGTTMLMLKSPWLLHWLNHGRHLTAFATYRYELYTTNHTGAYVLMLMFFPVIGLITSYLAAVIANPAPLDARSPSPGLPMTTGE